MRKELNIKIPRLRGRLHIAYPLMSVLKHPDGECFLNNYFLNMECLKEGDDINFCFLSQIDQTNESYIHYLNFYWCYMDFLGEKQLKLHDAIQNEINQGNLVYIFFDDYFLPNKINIHFSHVNLIYGYDLEENNYLSIGYDENMEFNKLPIPFEAAEKGYDFPIVDAFRTDYNKSFCFNKDHFILQIEDYLNSENRLVSEEAMNNDGLFKKDFLYGLAVYDKIIQFIDKQKNEEIYDHRILYQLQEHAKNNEMRLDYLVKVQKMLLSEKTVILGKELADKAEHAKHLMYKYTFSQKNAVLSKVKDLLKEHKLKSEEFYTRLHMESR